MSCYGPMGPVSVGDYIDMSVFRDAYDTFTTPNKRAGTGGTAYCANNTTGGYKKIGNIVYVKIQAYFNNSAFTPSAENVIDDYLILDGLPTPAAWFELGTETYSMPGTFVKAGIMSTGASSPNDGLIRFTVDKSKIKSTSRCYIVGAYITKE